MENSAYVALSRQMVLRHQLEVVANNIANADTTGFKFEKLIVNTSPKKAQGAKPGDKPINYALDMGVGRDFSQGALARTGNALDLGIEGNGFFKVTDPQGDRYTRDGRFTVDDQGRLVTRNGLPVQGEGGDITLDPKKGEPMIAPDGTVSQGSNRVGKLALYRFDDMTGLSKAGEGLYKVDANISPQAAPDATIHQATLESSNVQPILEITNMIEVSRAYEQVSKMMDQTAELDRTSIERLGRAS